MQSGYGNLNKTKNNTNDDKSYYVTDLQIYLDNANSEIEIKQHLIHI